MHTDKSLRSVTKRTYDSVTPPGTIYIICHSSNVIYLITCNRSQLQYAGEPVQKQMRDSLGISL